MLGRGTGMPCDLRGALLALGDDMVVGIRGELRVGEDALWLPQSPSIGR
jgi:hypothetical protein